MSVDNAIQYARDVTSDRVAACQLVKQAAARFLSDLQAAEQPDSVWEYRRDLAERVMRWCQLLPNIKGPLAGQLLKLMPWQEFTIANLFGFVERGTISRRFRQGIIFIPRGNGKGLALDTEIATPSGFTRMGDIRVDDEVFDIDGHICRVIGVSPVNHRPCYEVEFSTGEVFVCDDEHLWLTQSCKERDNAAHRRRTDHNRRRRYTATTESAKSTTEIAQTIGYGNPRAGNEKTKAGSIERNHRVRLAAPLALGNADLPVDPYLLGYWLGDGNSNSPRITVGAQDALQFAVSMCVTQTPISKQVSLEVQDSYGVGCLPRGKKNPTGLLARLRGLGVLNNKHIPQAYLRASVFERWRLLQGLMDSDGSASPQGRCEFSNMSHRLATDVLELVASLGLRPTLRESDARCNGKYVGRAYKALFHGYSHHTVFALPRKQSRLPAKPAKGSLQGLRTIVDVRPVQSVPTRCIAVDSPTQTYLIGRTFIPTHNTTFAAPIMLYMAFCDHEGGAEAYAAAVSRDQSKLLWDSAKMMVQKTPDLAKALGITVAAHSIFQTRSGSKCIAVSSDAKSLEGLSVHFACCDEIASHLSSSVYDVMLTACGKRKHPLMLSISTATGNNHGIGRTLWDYSTRVLNHDQDDDRLFALVYTTDDGDDPWDEATWVKANPSWGVSVQPDAIRAIMRQARNNPAQEAAAMTRHLNVWVGADEALFSTRAWRACADPNLKLEDFEGQECELAVDLANKVDLAALSLVFPGRDGDKTIYAVFGRHYINENAVLEARNAMYPLWARDGHLTLTAGNETDFQVIESDIIALCKRFRVRSVAFDPWQSAMLAQRLMSDNIDCVEVKQNVQNMSEPTKELQAAMVANRIRHNGDPVLEWAIGNVVGHVDINSNVKPNKSRDEAQKIDPAIALIMAIARCVTNEVQDSVYETRGLLVLGDAPHTFL